MIRTMNRKVRAGAKVISMSGTKGVVRRMLDWGRIAEVETAFGVMTFRKDELLPA